MKLDRLESLDRLEEAEPSAPDGCAVGLTLKVSGYNCGHERNATPSVAAYLVIPPVVGCT